MMLFEWYPAGGDTKSIVVSDATASAPAVQIVPDTAGAAIHANWSHDGTMLTWEVLGDDTASAWVANADGSLPMEVAVCPGDRCVQMAWPSFSADDTSLLVTRYDLADNGDWGQSHLVLVDIATGEQTVIASTPDGTTSFYSASMSPDGTQVAAALETYTDATQDERVGAGIVVYDTDPATADEPMTVTPGELFAGYPRWHPSEPRILFASWDLDAFQGAEPSQLYTVAPDGSSLVQITDVDHTTTTRRPGEANWTPDGTGIVASIGIVRGGSVADVKIATVDPGTGAITETATSGAMPSLQP